MCYVCIHHTYVNIYIYVFIDYISFTYVYMYVYIYIYIHIRYTHTLLPLVWPHMYIYIFRERELPVDLWGSIFILSGSLGVCRRVVVSNMKEGRHIWGGGASHPILQTSRPRHAPNRKGNDQEHAIGHRGPLVFLLGQSNSALFLGSDRSTLIRLLRSQLRVMRTSMFTSTVRRCL